MYTRLWSSASGSEGEILESLKYKNGHLSDTSAYFKIQWLKVRKNITYGSKKIIFIFIFDDTYLKIKKMSMY